MAKEIIELGRKGSRKRVCVRVIADRRRGGFLLSEYDRRTGRHKNYIGAPCKRVKGRSKALVIETRAAADAYAKRCKIDRCRI